MEQIAENLVVHVEIEGDLVGRLMAAFFRAEIKKPGVEFGVGVLENLAKSAIDARSVREAKKPAVELDPSIFADPEEDDPVDDALDGEVELALAEAGIAHGDISGQLVPPTFDGRQNIVIHFAVPRFVLLVSANLSKDPLRTASLEKMDEIQSHFSR